MNVATFCALRRNHECLRKRYRCRASVADEQIPRRLPSDGALREALDNDLLVIWMVVYEQHNWTEKTFVRQYSLAIALRIFVRYSVAFRRTFFDKRLEFWRLADWFQVRVAFHPVEVGVVQAVVDGLLKQLDAA